MKKLIISLISLFLVASCATTQPPQPDPYAHVSVENIKKNCEATENWQVAAMGLGALVIRFDDCLGHKILLVVASDNQHTAQYTPIIRETSMGLMALHYVEYLKRTHPTSADSKTTYSISKVKEEEKEGWLSYYFLITSTTTSCGEKGCAAEE